MSALVALGMVPGEAPAKPILAPSRPAPRPHFPRLRHSPTFVEPEARISQGQPSNRVLYHGLILQGERIQQPWEDAVMSDTTNTPDLRTEEDGDLLIRYQGSDDAAAIAELNSRYWTRLVRYVRHFGGSIREQDAEDIVQKAFVDFHTNRKSYPLKTNVRTLLHKICTDHYYKHLEYIERDKRDHRRTVPLLDQADPKTAPAHHESKMDTDERLSTLTPEQQDAVRLMRIEGHTAESAAELRDVSASAMRKREERGIEAMKRQAMKETKTEATRNRTIGRDHIKALATTCLILLALVGVVFDNCDFDVCWGMCTAEEDVDEVIQPGGGSHHDSDKQRRKSRLRLPIWPETPGMANMTRTTVVNAHNSEYEVLIARPSKWGNPFQIGRDGDRERVIQMYETHIRRRPDLLAALPKLAGKRLGCYCKPESCHGDVLVKLLRELFWNV
jgi:RNA polymerase sigma factor (sigma-70 family)